MIRGRIVLHYAPAAAMLAVGGIAALVASCEPDVSLGKHQLSTAAGGSGGDGIGGFPMIEPCTLPDADTDGDGFMIIEGDCDDCDDNVNPNAVEVVAPDPNSVAKDEDCDGIIDEVDPPCDDGLVLYEVDAGAAARAIDLCKVSSGPRDWGLVSASWTQADGSPVPPGAGARYHLGHAIFDGFGPNVSVRRGDAMLALSSGRARRPGDQGYSDHMVDKAYSGEHPEGFPKESPACPGVTSGIPHDAAALDLAIRTPSNAAGIAFNFNFYTYEWPQFVCSKYNDVFVALLKPKPPDMADGAITFDSRGNPVSVNNAFLDVCGCEGNPPNDCIAGVFPNSRPYPCASGNAELMGTGFGFDTEGIDHAATGWLITKAPVPPNYEIRLRFAIYDSEDGEFDTLALIDNLRWIALHGTGTITERVPK